MTGAPVDRRATAIILIAALGWPLIEAAGGILLTRHDPFEVVALRYSAHLALLLPVAFWHSGFDLLRTERPVLQLVRGAVMFLMPVLFLAGSSTAGAGWVWSCFWSTVLIVLFGALLVGERPVATAWAVAGIGLVGSWFSRGSPTGPAEAGLFGVASAVCFAGYVVLSRVLRDEALETSLFYTAVGALVPTLVLAAPAWVSPTAVDLLPVVGLGALSLLILGSIDLSLERAGLASVAPWLIAVPALEVVASTALGHGLPGRRALFGCGLIVAGLALWAARSEGISSYGDALHDLREAR
jgi:drug/metabolite transporter (DMT)-like permease